MLAYADVSWMGKEIIKNARKDMQYHGWVSPHPNIISGFLSVFPLKHRGEKIGEVTITGEISYISYATIPSDSTTDVMQYSYSIRFDAVACEKKLSPTVIYSVVPVTSQKGDLLAFSLSDLHNES